MRIIITVNGGLVQSVFTDSDDVSVDILDHDCFNDWDIGEEEKNRYAKLESELESCIANGTMKNHW